MSLAHWESYYRGGTLAACPTGPQGDYTLELRDIWSAFFARLTDGARVLDIGTGNGAIALIARQTAQSLGRRYEIHGADLARVNPTRDVADGARLFASITFHPQVATENLPFASASFDAVSGHYALEYTEVPDSFAQIMRVLRAGADAQFVMHHADSILVQRARATLRDADLVLSQTTVYRKLRRFLDAEQRSPAKARASWEQLGAALSILRQNAGLDNGTRVIDVTLDAVPKLLGQRHTLTRGALAREVDAVEEQLRDAVRRVNDLIAVALSEAGVNACAEHARRAGFALVTYRPLWHAQDALVGWQMCVHKPEEMA